MYRTWLAVSSLMALSSLETRSGTAMLLVRPTLGQHGTLSNGWRSRADMMRMSGESACAAPSGAASRQASHGDALVLPLGLPQPRGMETNFMVGRREDLLRRVQKVTDHLSAAST